MNFGASKSGVKLKDLIRSVRNCKTQQEERTVMAKESAFLRDAAKLQHSNYKHRNVAKLIYIHMMGYPTHFGQMECLKLIASPGFPEKRIGYLGLMILLDERQEVLMLVTNSLKTDLQSKDHFVVGLALTALANIGSTEMARDLAPEVESLLSSREPYIRKKAALCCMRMLRKAPELVEQLRLRTLPNANLLGDRSHAVLLAAITLHLHICEADPDAIPEYRKYVKKLCTLMTQLGRHSADYDANGINDPFLQVKILRLLRFLGKNCPEAADQMVDCLTQVASRTEHTKYSGNAVLYETVLTIMAIPCSSGLRSLAVNIMGKFLVQSDNNIRYVALSTLAKAVVIDTQAVQRHRQTVVECVRDTDVSIRRRALDLVYALVNESNIRTLAAELLDYLAVCDVTDFKPDLTNKICQLIMRHSPDRRWHIESLFQVLVQAGQHVKEEVCRALVVLIGNTPELQAFTSRLALRTLQQHRNSSADSLITVCCWCLGEFGHLLVAPVERWEEGEPYVQVTEAAVVDTIAHVLDSHDVSNVGKEYALTAAVKLSARLPNQTPKLRSLISKFQRSLSLEVQQRSCEYSRLFGFDALRPALLECVPALDESSYTGNLRRSDVVEKAAEARAAAAEGPAGDDLSSLIDLVASRDAPAAAAAASQPAAANATAPQPGFSGLDDLLGSLDAGHAAPPAATTSSNLMDLLGAAAPAPAPVPAVAVPPVVPQGAADSLADLLAGPGAAMPGASMPIAAPAAQFPPVTAFEKAPLLVRFSFAKDSMDATTTHITVQVTNTGVTPLDGFVLKVAVPKYMTMRLEPASGSVVPPQGSGSVQQLIHVTNGQHGVKALAMRLQLQYQLAGQQVLEQVQVKSFPPGL